MIYRNIYDLVGNTPLMKLGRIKGVGEGNILAKLEFLNPSGSIKDRAAHYMIKDAEEKNILRPGGTIIEPTSGNTGIGLAMIGAAKGYRVILVMPATMTIERQKLIKAYGAEIILTDGELGMSGSVDHAKKLARENGYFLANQFGNLSNRQSHVETTVKEIIRDTEGRIDAFVAGVGTGGTLSGVGEGLKKFNPEIKIYGVQPENSQTLTGGNPGPHKLQGIGADFIPDLYNKKLVDGMINIRDEEAFEYSRRLGKEEGLLVGITAGANVAAAKKIAKELGEKSNIITVLPDTGERYLSTELFSGE